MNAAVTTQGRRREDVAYGDLPDDLQPGDYWRYLDPERRPLVAGGSIEKARSWGNLTGSVWGVYAPRGGVGTLIRHTVREHDDETISVRPGDGSSNSILIGGAGKASWHGYIERGIWRES